MHRDVHHRRSSSLPSIGEASPGASPTARRYGYPAAVTRKLLPDRRGACLPLVLVVAPLLIWFAVSHDQVVLGWALATAVLGLGAAQLGEWRRRRTRH
jgi:hypothetical protein